jgi:hypothetical protein
MLCEIPYTIDEIKIPHTVQGRYLTPITIPHGERDNGAELF